MGHSAFSLSFLSQFFIEHCTLFFTIVSCGLAVYSVIFRKKKLLPVIAMALGHVIGSIGMVLIPKIFTKDFGNLAGYRSHSDGLIRLIEGNVEYAGRYTLGCFPVWCVLSITMLWLISKEMVLGNEKYKKIEFVKKILNILYILTTTCFFFLRSINSFFSVMDCL